MPAAGRNFMLAFAGKKDAGTTKGLYFDFDSPALEASVSKFSPPTCFCANELRSRASAARRLA